MDKSGFSAPSSMCPNCTQFIWVYIDLSNLHEFCAVSNHFNHLINDEFQLLAILDLISVLENFALHKQSSLGFFKRGDLDAARKAKKLLDSARETITCSQRYKKLFG